MATTLLANVFNPEVATRVASALFPSRLAVGFAGSPFVQGFPPEAIIGVEGDTVKFPRWNALGEFAALTEDVAMVPEAMGTAEDTSAVQVAGKAVEITDFATLAARGDPNEEAGRQYATLAARYVDQRLIVEAETSTLADIFLGTVTWAAFTAEILLRWGDKAFEQVGGFVVHSKVFGDMLSLDEFRRADFVQGQANLAQDAAGRPVGFFGPFPVYLSDRITVDLVPTPDEYDCLILKRGALGLKFQRTLLVESDRDILKKNDVLAADVRFAVHLMFGVPSPVIVWSVQ